MECCSKSLKDNILTCANCKLSFHCKCLNISTTNYNKAKKSSAWKCAKCSTPRGKRGDETPVSSAIVERDDVHSSDEELLIDELCSQQTHITADSLKGIFNNFLRKVEANMNLIKTEILEKVTTSQKELSKELNLINSKFGAIQKKQEALESSLSGLSGFYDELNQKHKNLVTENNNLKARIAELTRSSNDMMLQIDDAQKYIASKFIEIRNVPPNAEENLLEYFSNLCNALNIEFKAGYVCNIFRKRTYKEDSQHILLELNNESYKQDILSAVKQLIKRNKEKLSTKHFGIHGEPRNVYVSELLSPKVKYIYFKCRLFAKTHKYEYCWVKNGRIYLRKHKNEPAVLVRSEQQLTDLAALPPGPADQVPASPARLTPDVTGLPVIETQTHSRRTKINIK